MSKENLKEQLKVLENYINDIPNIFDVCKECQFVDVEMGVRNNVMCKECCWYYGSKFKQKEK